MTTFKKLYDYCQTLSVPPKVSRNTIRTKAEELSKKKIVVLKINLDTDVSRGFFLSASNLDSPLVKQAKGNNVVALARGMNPCWERFVQVKEMMHLFDSEDEKTGSAEVFLSLLTDLEVMLPEQKTSKQKNSEIACMWMALACLCPEVNRQQFVDAFAKNHLDHHGIALQLRIPRQLVPSLLHPNFQEVVNTLCG